MLPKRFPSQAFEPISNHRIANGFTDRNSKSRHIKVIWGRVKAEHPLANKALAGKDFGKVPV